MTLENKGNMKSNTVKWAVGISVLVLLAIFAIPLITQKAEGIIKVGILTPLTGAPSEYGINTKNGIDLAVNEINSAGGIAGRELELFYEDSKCDPKEAISGFNKLVDVDGVNIILGTICSGETLAIAPLANEKQVLIISTGASSPNVANAGEYIFRLYPSDDYEGRIAAETIFTTLNKKSVAILYVNNEYGSALQKVFRERFESLGGSVLDEETYAQDSADFRTQLIKIKDKNPEVVYVIGYPKEAGLIAKQSKELQLTSVFFGTSGLKGEDFISTGGSAAERFYVLSPKAASSQKAIRFGENYESLFQRKPGLTSDRGYDSVYVLREAILASANINGVKDNLYTIQNFEGASGTISFDENGDVVGQEYELSRVENGKFMDVGKSGEGTLLEK